MDINTAREAFDNLAGGTFVGMDTATVPVLKGGRKNPQQGRVVKVTQGAQVMCFSNTRGSAYEAMVKRRLAAEGKDADDFEVGPRAWGQREPGTPFVLHDGKAYLEVIFLRAGKTHYELDGVVVSKDDIQGLPTPRDDAEGQGGLENKVVIRTFALDSITALRANGEEWR